MVDGGVLGRSVTGGQRCAGASCGQVAGADRVRLGGAGRADRGSPQVQSGGADRDGRSWDGVDRAGDGDILGGGGGGVVCGDDREGDLDVSCRDEGIYGGTGYRTSGG